MFPDLVFQKHPFRKKTDSDVVTMLTAKIIYPFRGDVNPRVSLACSVDENGKASEAREADARVNKGKAGEFTQHQQRRDDIVIHPRIGADVEFG